MESVVVIEGNREPIADAGGRLREANYRTYYLKNIFYYFQNNHFLRCRESSP